MADYERRKCSQCGEGLELTEDDLCDKCWLELEILAEKEQQPNAKP